MLAWMFIMLLTVGLSWVPFKQQPLKWRSAQLSEADIRLIQKQNGAAFASSAVEGGSGKKDTKKTK